MFYILQTLILMIYLLYKVRKEPIVVLNFFGKFLKDFNYLEKIDIEIF